MRTLIFMVIGGVLGIAWALRRGHGGELRWTVTGALAGAVISLSIENVSG